jgi:hypothetical protein
MPRSRFKILNRVQDQGGARWTTTVIVIYFFATLRPHSFKRVPSFFATLRPHSFKRVPSFEDWPPRYNAEIGPEGGG